MVEDDEGELHGEAEILGPADPEGEAVGLGQGGGLQGELRVHLLLGEGQVVPGGKHVFGSRDDDVMVEVPGLDPGLAGDRIEVAVDRRALTLGDAVVGERCPGMAAANLALVQSREKAAGEATVADSAGAHLPVLLQAPKLERQASSQRIGACGRA